MNNLIIIVRKEGKPGLTLDEVCAVLCSTLSCVSSPELFFVLSSVAPFVLSSALTSVPFSVFSSAFPSDAPDSAVDFSTTLFVPVSAVSDPEVT